MEKQPRNEDSEEEVGNERPRSAPRIYVASLSDYNAGRLYGRWIDVDDEPEELQQQISDMLAGSPTIGAEEWAIHDYEGFGPLHLSEYESVDTLSLVGRGITEHGEAFAHWAGIVGTSDQEALGRFEDAYLGVYDSTTAYAEDMLSDLGYIEAVERAVPEGMQPYVHIDVEGFGRDLELAGDISVSEGSAGVYIFEGNP